MKTKELIRQLKEADPSGELECAIGGNIDIFSVYTTPTYYDGYLEILKRDHSKDPYYNVCGATITGMGTKVKIETCSIDDAIFDDIDLPVEIIGDPTGYYKERVEKYRKEAKEIYEQVEKNKEKEKKVVFFGEHIREAIQTIKSFFNKESKEK